MSPTEDGGVRGRRRASGRRSARLGLMWALLGLLLGSSLGTAQVGADEDPFFDLRRDMVEQQVRQRGIHQPRVLSAMEEVRRHRFVPESLGPLVYRDEPVSFAPGQNLSQAYLTARMVSLLELEGGETVLEIGTGSGYDAAVLSRLAKRVYTVEIDEGLGEKARTTLKEQGYTNVEVKIGDGYRGWPEKGPFDAILLTAAAKRVPEPLFQQLKIGGKMVVAVGYSLHQDLKVITRLSETERVEKRVSLISLTPMTGEVTRDPKKRPRRIDPSDRMPRRRPGCRY